MAPETDWMEAWAPVVASVGTDLDNGSIRWGADAVEQSAVRQFLEPLEFDCPLHYDEDLARAAGFADITAPYSSVLLWVKPPVWAPGEIVFGSADRNAQPLRLSVKPKLPLNAPHAPSFFVVDLEIDYMREVTVGERLGQRANRLAACVPKETKVGRGAFVTHEREVVDADARVVAFIRIKSFMYDAEARRT